MNNSAQTMTPLMDKRNLTEEDKAHQNKAYLAMQMEDYGRGTCLNTEYDNCHSYLICQC